MRLVFKYTSFAVIATLLNLAAQDAVVRLVQGPWALYLSIGAGTLIGLFAKYVLDKKYIFAYRADSLMKDGETFILYMVMSVVTTLIFWGTELGFEFVFETKPLRYLGAVIGLTVGYIVKYRLDKRFVFVKPA